MSGPSGSDKSLLDRLSALKGGGGGISLDRTSNALNVSLTGIEPAKPPSREDALAARLRSLRNTPELEEPPISSVTQRPAVATPPTASQSRELDLPSKKSSEGPSEGHPAAVTDDDAPLWQTDDRALEQLLEDEDPAADAPWAVDPKEESKRVEALLEELSKASTARDMPAQGYHEDKPSDDDSDGEEMSREVEILLSQALEGAKLDPDPAHSEPHELPDPHASDVVRSNPARDQGDADDKDDDEPGFSLPSLPSGMHDPGKPEPGTKRRSGDFDDDIAVRMAALRGLGSPAGEQSDSIGLPSVPTFKPSDRAAQRKTLTTTTGYKDDDMEGWCTVCLEDATLRCLGCDNDVYCTRCWREMHIGPTAAFDDRTHKAVQFVKDRKKKEKKVALGA